MFPTDILNAIFNEDTIKLMEYRHLIKNLKYSTIWKKAYGKELGRLSQGIPDKIHGTNTIGFIPKHNISVDRCKDVTYGRICANFWPEKDDPHQIRLTIGGNRINFPDDCSTPTANMLTTKILLNSIISTHGARFMTIDIKDFNFNTPMDWPEFMQLKLADIPEKFIELYNIRKLATPDEYIYVRVQKGVYGLPQAGIIAQQLLENA